MKTFCLTMIIAVFLLLCAYGIHAQTTQTELDQVELMTQLLGTWESQMSQDTIWSGECKTIWNGLE